MLCMNVCSVLRLYYSAECARYVLQGDSGIFAESSSYISWDNISSAKKKEFYYFQKDSSVSL